MSEGTKDGPIARASGSASHGLRLEAREGWRRWARGAGERGCGALDGASQVNTNQYLITYNRQEGLVKAGRRLHASL